jgi:hypothetical protein
MRIFRRKPSGVDLAILVGQSHALGMKQLVLDYRFIHGEIGEDEWHRLSMQEGIASDASGETILSDA